MSRQIEQALLSLMPTQSSDLPPTLIELAGSLLAQSRHRASTLKADEEVARLYACAHLACERLKISLNLPPIDPRPPIPPRIYKRLYTHLDNIIPSATAADRSNAGKLRTPSSKARDLGSSPFSQQRPVPSRGTPTKEQSLSQFRTQSNADPHTPTKSTGKPLSKDALPSWIKPVSRFLCAETDNPRLAPTLLAGMESILTPGNKAAVDEWAVQNVVALYAAIYFFVTSKVRAMATGEAMSRHSYVPQRKEILALLRRAREEVTIPGDVEDSAWSGWADLRPIEFDNAVAKVNERDWLQEDWYKAIDDIMQASGNEDLDMLEADQEAAAPGVQIRRADTMFQDKYDYLSEKRQTDYKAWRDDILARIDEQLAGNGSMELDTS